MPSSGCRGGWKRTAQRPEDAGREARRLPPAMPSLRLPSGARPGGPEGKRGRPLGSGKGPPRMPGAVLWMLCGLQNAVPPSSHSPLRERRGRTATCPELTWRPSWFMPDLRFFPEAPREPKGHYALVPQDQESCSHPPSLSPPPLAPWLLSAPTEMSCQCQGLREEAET